MCALNISTAAVFRLYSIAGKKGTNKLYVVINVLKRTNKWLFQKIGLSGGIFPGWGGEGGNI